jgi:hypothetical protein
LKPYPDFNLLLRIFQKPPSFPKDSEHSDLAIEEFFVGFSLLFFLRIMSWDYCV